MLPIRFAPVKVGILVQPQREEPEVELLFKYIGGDPAIDLVNTVDWTSHGLKAERLESYERLTRWAEGAGVVPPRVAAALGREAGGSREQAEAAHRRAIRAREILSRLFR